MSDDRYNDPHRRPQPAPFGDEDDKTQMVDLNQLQDGGPEPQFAPPPTMDPGEATQLFEIPASMHGSDDDAITSSAPDYSSSSLDRHSPYPSAPQAPHPSPPRMGSGPVHANYHSQSHGAPPPSTSSGAQVYIGDEGAGFEGHTEFVNIADFAQEKAHFTPEQQQAGYDGNTQFVDINALLGGNQIGGGDAIDQDDELKRGYQFGPDDVQRGDVTLIHATNPLGHPVLLKLVWEGDPNTMTTPLRQRIAQLHQLKHPNLVAMNGMFVSRSGMWVELEAPRGDRLTAVLQAHGPQSTEQVLKWAATIADVLDTIHSQQLAYANLTTDAIWIDPSGAIQIEPFDMLRLDDRGNLGAFGPPEMDAPPDRRQLSPATDVFSLAAVITASLTGLPLQHHKLTQLDDKKLSEALSAAMNPAAAERPQSAVELVNGLKGSELDIKIVGAGAAIVLLLLIIVIAASGRDDAPPPQQQFAPEPEMAAQALGDPLNTGTDTLNGAAKPLADLPGVVTNDPRLIIQQSYAENPPITASTTASEADIDRWRDEARDHEAEGDRASRSQRYDHYSQALQLWTRVIRAQESPADSDWKAWRNLYENSAVNQEIDRVREELNEALAEGNLSQARRRYRTMVLHDPRANADDFLNAHNTATVVEVRRSGANDDNDD